MKRSVKLEMFVMSLVVFFVCGCATLGGGESDEAAIMKVVEGWKAAMLAKDLEGIMAVYSEDYVGRRDSGKEEMRGWMERAVEGERFDNIQIGLDGMQVTVNEGTATAGPVSMPGRGNRTREFNYKLDATDKSLCHAATFI